jgi:hypothetical protein
MATESIEELGGKTPEITITVDTTAIAIQESQELTTEEEGERHRLELKVELGFPLGTTVVDRMRGKSEHQGY